MKPDLPNSSVPESVRKGMRANRSKDTGPEVRLRQLLWAAGLRGYRKHRSSLPGKPDVSWGKPRLALFLNGCFWHGCPLCTARGRTPIPKQNAAYWTAKREANQRRQIEQIAKLESIGWRTLVVWECELRQNPAAVVAKVTELVGSESRGEGSPS